MSTIADARGSVMEAEVGKGMVTNVRMDLGVLCDYCNIVNLKPLAWCLENNCHFTAWRPHSLLPRSAHCCRRRAGNN